MGLGTNKLILFGLVMLEIANHINMIYFFFKTVPMQNTSANGLLGYLNKNY